MTSLFQLLEQLSNELPGCRLTSIVDQATGLPLVSVSAGDALQSAGADAYHSDLYRMVAGNGQSSGQAAQGFVLTGKEAVFVSVPLPDTGYFWHIATARSTTVGFTQALMRKHVGRIQESLKSLVGE